MIRAVLALFLAATTATAHDGEVHKTPTEAANHQATTGPASPFDLDLGGTFELTDQTGATRSQADPAGRPQLLFFGYANCPSICSVALPLMGEVTDLLDAGGLAVTPLMITIDPERDTPATIGAPLALHHRRFVGLTGSDDQLQTVYDLFSVERKMVFEDPERGPIYAHGSHIYLLDAEGEFLTLLPPILGAEHMAGIVRGYIADPGS